MRTTAEQNNHYLSKTYMRPFTEIADDKRQFVYYGTKVAQDKIVVERRNVSQIFYEKNTAHHTKTEVRVQKIETEYGKLVGGKTEWEIAHTPNLWTVATRLLYTFMYRHPVHAATAKACNISTKKFFQPLRNALRKMNGRSLILPKDNPIVTNDRGYAISHAYGNGLPEHIRSNVALNPDAIVFMPITPWLVLVYSWQNYPEELLRTAPSEHINKALAYNSLTGIIGHSKDLVQQYGSCVTPRLKLPDVRIDADTLPVILARLRKHEAQCRSC